MNPVALIVILPIAVLTGPGTSYNDPSYNPEVVAFQSIDGSEYSEPRANAVQELIK